MSDILGRVIYSLRLSVDHGPIRNSEIAMQKESPNESVKVHDDVCKKIMFLLNFSLITHFYLRTIDFLLSLKTLFHCMELDS